MSGGVLYLAHRIPFPPDRGDKIRSHHVLKHLAGLAPVHVGCLADDEAELEHAQALDAIAATSCVVRRRKPVWLAGVEAMLRGKPVSLTAFHETELADYVVRTIAEHGIETIHVFSGQMGQYIPADFGDRVVVDLGDVDSAKFEAYAAETAWPMAWIHAREGRLMRAEEQKLAERAQHTLFVSEAEAALFLSRLVAARPVNVGAMPNGIDTNYFDPTHAGSDPYAGLPGPHIVFTGQMNYPPNMAAAERLALQIMPLIRREFPTASCHIVGRNPPPAVNRLDGRNGCKVWGTVPDVRPYLAAADLVMVPLDIARGVQNKVLEAMAMARPVALSPDAATGIEGEDDVHFAVGRDDAAIAARALVLLGNGPAAKAMGEAARAFVIARHGWDHVLAPLSAWEGLDAAKQGQGLAAA